MLGEIALGFVALAPGQAHTHRNQPRRTEPGPGVRVAFELAQRVIPCGEAAQPREAIPSQRRAGELAALCVKGPPDIGGLG